MGNEMRLSEAEALIMQCFWENGPLNTRQLSAMLATRNWKPTTLLTFLARLVEKDMLTLEKQGKSNLYRPLQTQEAYQNRVANAFLEDVYGGNTQAFLASMVSARGISKNELAELRAWLQQKEAELDE